MKLVEYKCQHFPLLVELLKANKSHIAHAVTLNNMPETGFIVFDVTPVAMGFLRKVEGGAGMIDTLVTDPKASSELRHNAINLIVDELMKSAKHMKLYGVFAFTQEKCVISRARALGFNIAPDKLIHLNLK